MAKLTTGVGVSLVVKKEGMPLPAMTSAAVAAKASERNRALGRISFLLQEVGNALANQAGIGKGEIIRQNSPPSRSSEFDLDHGNSC